MLQPATVRRRFAACFLDFLVYLIPTGLLHLALPWVGPLLLSFFYKPVFEASSVQATPGKWFLGIQVVDLNGGRITFKAAMIRFLTATVSGWFLCMGHLIALFHPQKRAAHDLIADTLVIRLAKPETPEPFSKVLDAWVAEIQEIFSKTGSSARPESAQKQVDRIEALEKLHSLYLSGAITETEYHRQKAELLK